MSSPHPEPVQGKPICPNPEDCCRALTRVWHALGIDSYTGKSVDEHVTELRAELRRVTTALEEMTQERDNYRTKAATTLLVDISKGTQRLEAAERDLAALREDSQRLTQLVRDHEDCAASTRRLTRELDVALFGDEAAPQAALCDLIGPAQQLRESHAQALREAFDAGADWARGWSIFMREEAFAAFLASREHSELQKAAEHWKRPLAKRIQAYFDDPGEVTR